MGGDKPVDLTTSNLQHTNQPGSQTEPRSAHDQCQFSEFRRPNTGRLNSHILFETPPEGRNPMRLTRESLPL